METGLVLVGDRAGLPPCVDALLEAEGWNSNAGSERKESCWGLERLLACLPRPMSRFEVRSTESTTSDGSGCMGKTNGGLGSGAPYSREDAVVFRSGSIAK